MELSAAGLMHRPRSAKHHTRPSVTVPSLPCADLWPAGGAWHQHQAELTFRLPHCVCCSQRPANGTRRGVGEAFERSAATASSKARVGVPPSLTCRLCPSGQQHQHRHQQRTAGGTRAHASVQAPTSRLNRCLRLGGGSVSWHRANVLCHAGPESTGSRRLLWQSMCTACVRCVVATLVRGGPHNHAAAAATCRHTGGASKVYSLPPHHSWIMPTSRLFEGMPASPFVGADAAGWCSARALMACRCGGLTCSHVLDRSGLDAAALAA